MRSLRWSLSIPEPELSPVHHKPKLLPQFISPYNIVIITISPPILLPPTLPPHTFRFFTASPSPPAQYEVMASEVIEFVPCFLSSLVNECPET